MQVVWGLSILGHVPRNSLLESLAGLLTDRFRRESGGAWDAATETTGGERPAVSDGTMAASSGGGGVEGRGAVDARPDGDGSVSGADDHAASDKDGRGHDDGGAGGGMPVAAEAKAKAKSKAVGTLTTSGTDLATAALSFAYAHAR